MSNVLTLRQLRQLRQPQPRLWLLPKNKGHFLLTV